jgi:tRNA dimethylallyltransferase
MITVIMGPTASGKSKLAMDMAVKHGGVIINADSMQIYEGLPILTAKPTKQDTENVPHLLYGIWNPKKQQNVTDWLKIVYEILPNINQPIYIVGGTGFYIKALIQGLSAVPALDPSSRQQAQTMADHLSTQDFYDYVYQQDPFGAKDLHPLDQKRLIRLLEVIMSTGKPLHTFFDELLYPPLVVDRTIFLNPKRIDLHKHILNRIHGMCDNGVIEEVGEFLKNTSHLDHVFQGVIGFKEISLFLKKELSFEKMIDIMAQKTRQYSKRQVTFFSNQFKSFENFCENF